MSQKAICPVCGSSLVETFLRRRQVPVHQHLLMKDEKSAIEITRGDFNMVVCKECKFIFNQAFEPSKLNYGGHYDNSQACSPCFSEYLDSLVRYLVFEKNVKDCQVVEVGCGDGAFLKKLVEIEEGGNRGYGFDPSYIGPAVDLKGRIKFEKRYYGPECADIHADVVICRHVIEHVQDPLALLRVIRQALAGSSHARVFLETCCVEWILRNQVIWDFFYEHCSLFTAESLTTALETEGFNVQNARHIFAGQYLWLEAEVCDEKRAKTEKPNSTPHLVKEFAVCENKIREGWVDKVKRLSSQGKVAIWGAGAKGVTFANLIDPERIFIDCVVDLNPHKQGKYVPGTGHPIVIYQELARRGVKSAILMNPNYRDEIQGLLRQAGLDIGLIERQ